ncbi:MAG: Histidine kinase protein [Ignavibacteria bacterium]|nr:Histidine kinase protein [Ignavibacteria bacterium]
MKNNLVFLYNFLLFCCIIYSFSFSQSIANNIYPYSFSNIKYQDAGRLEIEPNGNSPDIRMYLIKPNWTEELEVLYTWRGWSRNNAKGISAGSYTIFAPFITPNTILVLRKNNEKVIVENYDSNLNIISNIDLPSSFEDILAKVQWLGYVSNKELLLLIDGKLFTIGISEKGILSSKMIAGNVLSAASFINEKEFIRQYSTLILVGDESGIKVLFVKKTGEELFSARLHFAEEQNIFAIGNQALVLSGWESNSQSLVQIIHPDKGISKQVWLNSKTKNIKLSEDRSKLYFLSISGKDFFIKRMFLSELKPDDDFEAKLPSGFIEPIGIWVNGGCIFTLFRNGIVSVDSLGTILSVDFLTLDEKYTGTTNVRFVKDHLLISSDISSLVLQRTENKFWFVNRYYQESGKIVIPVVLLIALIITIQLYRHQKRLLKETLELESAGIVFIIDKLGRLLKTNNNADELLGIGHGVPMKRQFHYYCNSESCEPLSEFVENVLKSRVQIKQRINLIDGPDVKEWYCTGVPMFNAAGNFRGIILTGVDITEQLERSRLSNWANLAHDMQTNLMTIKLNAELIETTISQNNIDRKNKIIFQVNLLIQRVRDLVTVAKGDRVDRILSNSLEICNAVRSEFDEALFPHIEFLVDANNFNLYCDKPKLIRAIRNAVENGIRSFQGDSGKILISSHKDGRYAYFSVRDNGKGMDDGLKNRILKPFFTTSKQQGGTGIGTMIMQLVMDLHGGKIEIDSEIGKGTEITFVLPLLSYHNKPVNGKKKNDE